MHTDAILTVLLVEDDNRLADLTRQYLERHNVAVTVVADGRQGLREALRSTYDAVLLDLMLPGMDGIQVCRNIRDHSDVPIIMLTARGEEADRVLGLEIGADDYMPKPFSPRELLARIRAAVRRFRGRSGPSQAILRAGRLHLDPGAARAVCNGNDLDLTAYEFAILYTLVQSAGRVLSREQIMDRAGGHPEEAFDRSIDVHISRLRRKLANAGLPPENIRTVRGLGYMVLVEESE